MGWTFLSASLKTQLDRIAAVAVKVVLPEGDNIRELEIVDGLYVIESGMVKVTRSAKDIEGVEAELAIPRPGNHFGEISLIDGLTIFGWRYLTANLQSVINEFENSLYTRSHTSIPREFQLAVHTVDVVFDGLTAKTQTLRDT